VVLSCQVDVLSEKRTVRARKVDEFEYAERPVGRIGCLQALYSVPADDDDLSRIEFPDIFRTDQIERAGLRRKDVVSVELSQAKGTKPVRIFDPDEFPHARQHDHGVCTLYSGHRFEQCFFKAVDKVFDKKMQENLGVHGGLKDRSRFFQFVFQGVGVHEIPIVGQGIGFFPVMDDKRLGVYKDRASGGGITHVPDGRSTVQLFQKGHVENIGNQPHALFKDNAFIPFDRYTGALLSPVLEGVKTKITKFCRIRVVVDAEYAACLSRLFVDVHYF